MEKKVKILAVVVAIFILGVGGLVIHDHVSGKQAVSSSQISLQEEAPPPNPATITNTAPQTTIPYKEGYDPVTGKPIKSDHEETPQAYGTPPPQESYPKMSKEYPYFAKLPPGAEGKIQVAYNYVVEYPGRYLVNLQVTNLSNRPLEGFYYDEFLKDNEGNILNEARNEGHHNAPPRFPLQPGNSVVLGTSKVAFSGSFGSTPIETWRVEIEVTYLKLN